MRGKLLRGKNYNFIMRWILGVLILLVLIPGTVLAGSASGEFCDEYDSTPEVYCNSGLVCVGKDNTHFAYSCMPSSISSGTYNIETIRPGYSYTCTGSYLEVALGDGGAMFNNKYPEKDDTDYQGGDWNAYSGWTDNYFCGVLVYQVPPLINVKG